MKLASLLRTHRTLLTGLVLSLLVCDLFLPQVEHFSHRNDAIRTVSRTLPFWQTLEELEYRLYDARFTARGPVRPASRDKIAIIGVDQKSLTELGDWPYPHEWHAQVIDRLKEAGAKVVFLDFDFSSRQNILSDAALARSLANAKNVLLPSFLARETQRNGGQKSVASLLVHPLDKNGYDAVFLNNAGQLLPKKSHEEITAFRTFAALGLDEQTPDQCLISVLRDSDGALRCYPLRTAFSDGDDNLGSVATLSVGVFQNLLDGEENKRYETALASAFWLSASGAALPIPIVAAQPPPGSAPQVHNTLINFWGPPSSDTKGTFATYSYKDILQRQVFSDAEMKKNFGGRMVFIGATALSLGDLFSMPQFVSHGPADDESRIPGVEIHATVAAMLLDGFYLRAASTRSTIITLFALSVVAALWIILLHNWVGHVARAAQHRWAKWHAPGKIHSLVWFSLYGFLAALPLVIFWESAKWLFVHQHLWVVVIYPALSAALSTGGVLILLYGSETAERRKTVAQFGRFMSPAILEEVLARPEEDYPRPRRAHATVLFTDLHGFTPYTESHDPEEVVRALNAYMTCLIPIVQRHQGTIDKYIGDSIMAYFGVPLPFENHAELALRCAVELQDANARFRTETGIEFYTRIGVHTGEVIAGSMGSEGSGDSQPLLNYTVIGDTVNLASRLEGANKEFGSWIMCSAATFQVAPDVVNVEAASTKIKGKSQVVEAYIVRGLAGQPPGDDKWGLR